MKLASALMTLAAGYGALQGANNRPALPFNDRDFKPDHATPVLYIHGINSRTAAFRLNAEHLRNEGFWVWGYDYGDMLAPGFFGVGDLDAIVEDVADNVDKVLSRTGAEQVDIVAHSQGGLMTKLYIAAGGAAKVRRVVAMGANFHGTDFSGRADWLGEVAGRVPRLASVIAPGAVQQLAGSSWVLERAGVPDTDPRVVYTSLYSPADTVVTPNSASELEPVDGADVANIDSAKWYDGYAPLHPLMPRDPLYARLTVWGLTRAVGEHTPPPIRV
ncbi:triacylglycerol lipase [Corynebacterium sp. Marseille-P4321]|uniref:esterase/lipase family protein n=1 Tax=Corynebacterium sp. Marseille-P4321 TaxID=2736603 RepID=UPI0020CA2BF2|nr:alpha/beta fold hydrolase [Corynebacterium sp. Marseille-P4321]